MIRSLKDLVGWTVESADGAVGSLQDLLFDDDRWMVRYLQVETGEWLNGRRVLLSPVALEGVNPEKQVLFLNLQKDQIRNSPQLEASSPLSREQEAELFSYYGWPFYWGPATVSGVSSGNLLASLPLIELEQEMQEARKPQPETAPRLRSWREFHGYRVRARDGEIGQVEDGLLDDESWRFLYLVVDTGGWLPGRKVLVSPTWVEQVLWDEAAVSFDLARETIQNSPEYDPSRPLERDYETRLFDHYGRIKYWDQP